MSLRRISLLSTLALSCLLPAVAQTEDYSKPKGHLFNFFSPYTSRSVPAPNFANTSRIEQLLREGKVMLSLNDAIALALENNLDLAIARYNLSIADTDILRTKSGASARGVATGLVQGTPGGGVGGLGAGAAGQQPGGTAAGTGGAGTGASGLVQSTLGVGAAVESFDPVLTSTFQVQRSTTPVSNTIFSGVPQLNQNTGTANFTYSQGFATGTALSVGFNNQRLTSNSIRTSLMPEYNSSMRFTVRQRLLSGFGLSPNLRFIRIAQNNREISDISFRSQVIATVSQIQNLYWDLVNAYEDVKVRERSVALANKTLSDNRKQVEIGTLAPIEITRAESEVALRNQELIVSQTNLQLQQLLMKNALTRNLVDETLATAPVIPTDTMSIPDVEEVVPTQDLINEALAHRPELAQARIDLTNRNINKKAASNALLPSLDVFAFYGTSSLAGAQNPAAICENQNPPQFGCTPASQALPTTGFGTAFENLWDGSAPDRGVGFQVNIPIRNRAAQADQVRSELEYRQAEMRLQQLQNQIRIEVRNAQFAVQQNRARVDAARKGRQLALQTLDAEQKKYALGASTNFQVLQAQRDLAVAESNLVTAMSAYEKSKVELDRVVGTTLNRNGIEIADAERGRVEKMPNVPYVTPRQDLK
jgi:outer membrane protein